jgi:hypothetical protein
MDRPVDYGAISKRACSTLLHVYCCLGLCAGGGAVGAVHTCMRAYMCAPKLRTATRAVPTGNGIILRKGLGVAIQG